MRRAWWRTLRCRVVVARLRLLWCRLPELQTGWWLREVCVVHGCFVGHCCASVWRFRGAGRLAWALSSVVVASFARAKQQVCGGWGGVEACLRQIVCNSGRVYLASEPEIGMYLRRPNNQQRGLVFCSRRCCHAGRTCRMCDSVYVLDTFYRGLF